MILYKSIPGLIICAALLTASGAQAQISGTAGYGGIGDPATAPGAPSQSYSLSAIDNINYYNGLVNITIPAYTVGGRGSAVVPAVIAVQKQWAVENSGGVSSPVSPEQAPSLSFFGASIGSQVLSEVTTATPLSACPAGQAFTSYMVFTFPEGTQTILRDLVYNGQPQCPSGSAGNLTYADRGRIFQSSDGTDLTFISNVDIVDGCNCYLPPVESPYFPAGVLLWRNGTRYLISTGDVVPNPGSAGVTTVEDRNGNVITLSNQEDSSHNVTVTAIDAIGRATTGYITQTVSIPGVPSPNVFSFPGAGGSTRSVTASFALLSSAGVLTTGESFQSIQSLFPELTGTSSWTPYYQQVLTSVVLADGTSTYTMQYNAYGEVTRLTLPTGGVYTYKYPEAYAGTGDGVIALSGGGYTINRRLLERDEYSDGVHLSAKILFSMAQQATGLDPNHASRPGIVTTVTFQDGNSNTLRVEKHYFYGNPTSTAQDPANPTQFADWWFGIEFQTDILNGSGKLLQRQQRVYQQRPCAQGENCWYDPQSDSAPAHDPQLCQVNTTNDAGQVSGLALQYDQYNNATDRYEFDFSSALPISASCPTSFAGASRHIHTTFVTGSYVATNTSLLDLPLWTNVSNSAGTQIAAISYTYDGSSPADDPGIVGHDSAYGTGFNARGNITGITRWWSDTNTNTYSSMTYDIVGNVLSRTDENGNTTQFHYNDDGQNKYAFVTSTTAPLSHTTSAQYDYGVGKPVSLTDLNGRQTQFAYNDPLNRLTQATLPTGGITNYSYPSPTEVIAVSDQTTSGDQALKSQQLYDGLGRPVETDTFESSSQYIATTASYDALGRVSSTTNPSRPGDGLNYGTTFGYDALGRQTSVTTADGSVTSTSYSGNQTTVTDPAGHTKTFTFDAFGRTTNVLEDPSSLQYQTAYLYDTLNNLTCVYQGSIGSLISCDTSQPHARSFTYDSLSRLVSATNPESGTVGYTYDAVGNLATRKDARGITTSYTYDALSRVTGASYTDGTPSVSYIYDAGGSSVNATGHLTQIANSSSITNFTNFDPVGEVLASNQHTSGQTFNFSYSYNLAGGLVTETYPSGRVVTTAYDGANRVSALSGNMDGVGISYLSQFTYTPSGGTTQYQRGNNVWRQTAYNSRLQTAGYIDLVNNSTSSELLNVTLSWGTTNNNGNLQQAVYLNGGPGYSQPLEFTDAYTYDNVNRLTATTDSGGWTRNFGYDQFGNMWVTTPASQQGIALFGNTPTSNVYATNNQISGGSYDSSGNQLTVGGATVAYDADNRQIAVTEPPSLGSAQENYLYDGHGQRVEKSDTGGPATIYVYDAFGQFAAEYSTATTAAPCATCFLSYDHLGSVRIVTDQNGVVVARHDYLPFGEEIPANMVGRDSNWGSTADVDTKFTGQIRDITTGLDFFNARYFGSTLGRFTSPDPGNAGANPSDPQTWNAYAYVRNNPLNGVDPTGREKMLIDPLESDLWSGSGINSGGLSSLCGTPGLCEPGGGLSFLYSPGLNDLSNASEQQYAQGVAQTEDAAATAKAANQALAAGNPVVASFLAAGNSNVAAVPVAPSTPDPTYNAFAVAAAMLGIDPNSTVQVLAQQRGVATAVQLSPLGSTNPYQAGDLSMSLNDIGTEDPSAISTLFHGSGNPSWYVGGATNTTHVVDIATPSQEADNPFQVGLQFHVDAYNPTASVVTLFQHFFSEVIPGHGIVGQPGQFLCSVNGGCH